MSIERHRSVGRVRLLVRSLDAELEALHKQLLLVKEHRVNKVDSVAVAEARACLAAHCSLHAQLEEARTRVHEVEAEEARVLETIEAKERATQRELEDKCAQLRRVESRIAELRVFVGELKEKEREFKAGDRARQDEKEQKLQGLTAALFEAERRIQDGEDKALAEKRRILAELSAARTRIHEAEKEKARLQVLAESLRRRLTEIEEMRRDEEATPTFDASQLPRGAIEKVLGATAAADIATVMDLFRVRAALEERLQTVLTQFSEKARRRGDLKQQLRDADAKTAALRKNRDKYFAETHESTDSLHFRVDPRAETLVSSLRSTEAQAVERITRLRAEAQAVRREIKARRARLAKAQRQLSFEIETTIDRELNVVEADIAATKDALLADGGGADGSAQQRITKMNTKISLVEGQRDSLVALLAAMEKEDAGADADMQRRATSERQRLAALKQQRGMFETYLSKLDAARPRKVSPDSSFSTLFDFFLDLQDLLRAKRIALDEVRATLAARGANARDEVDLTPELLRDAQVRIQASLQGPDRSSQSKGRPRAALEGALAILAELQEASPRAVFGVEAKGLRHQEARLRRLQGQLSDEIRVAARSLKRSTRLNDWDRVIAEPLLLVDRYGLHRARRLEIRGLEAQVGRTRSSWEAARAARRERKARAQRKLDEFEEWLVSATTKKTEFISRVKVFQSSRADVAGSAAQLPQDVPSWGVEEGAAAHGVAPGRRLEARLALQILEDKRQGLRAQALAKRRELKRLEEAHRGLEELLEARVGKLEFEISQLRSIWGIREEAQTAPHAALAHSDSGFLESFLLSSLSESKVFDEATGARLDAADEAHGSVLARSTSQTLLATSRAADEGDASGQREHTSGELRRQLSLNAIEHDLSEHYPVIPGSPRAEHVAKAREQLRDSIASNLQGLAAAEATGRRLRAQAKENKQEIELLKELSRDAKSALEQVGPFINRFEKEHVLERLGEAEKHLRDAKASIDRGETRLVELELQLRQAKEAHAEAARPQLGEAAEMRKTYEATRAEYEVHCASVSEVSGKFRSEYLGANKELRALEQEREMLLFEVERAHADAPAGGDEAPCRASLFRHRLAALQKTKRDAVARLEQTRVSIEANCEKLRHVRSGVRESILVAMRRIDERFEHTKRSGRQRFNLIASEVAELVRGIAALQDDIERLFTIRGAQMVKFDVTARTLLEMKRKVNLDEEISALEQYQRRLDAMLCEPLHFPPFAAGECGAGAFTLAQLEAETDPVAFFTALGLPDAFLTESERARAAASPRPCSTSKRPARLATPDSSSTRLQSPREFSEDFPSSPSHIDAAELREDLARLCAGFSLLKEGAEARSPRRGPARAPEGFRPVRVRLSSDFARLVFQHDGAAASTFLKLGHVERVERQRAHPRLAQAAGGPYALILVCLSNAPSFSLATASAADAARFYRSLRRILCFKDKTFLLRRVAASPPRASAARE